VGSTLNAARLMQDIDATPHAAMMKLSDAGRDRM
jgi:hypothetical protein